MALLMPKKLLIALILALIAAGQASAQSSLEARLRKALTVPHVSAAQSGAAVLDLATGKAVFGHNDGLALAPASNEKLAVAYAAISALGPAFRIETDVLGAGEFEGDQGLWRGDVILKGYGDPTLSTADLRSLASQVRAAGVRRITGRILGDESWFDARRTAPGWKAAFFIDESPPLSALVVDRARVGRRISVQPAVAAARGFRAALVAAGVAVNGGAALGLADDLSLPLAATQSASLASIVAFMDRESDNFTAEMLLKELGAVRADLGTTAAGAGVVVGELAQAGVPLDGVRIVDGSGLSLLDRMTANALVGLLQVAWADAGVRPVLLNSLPVAGIRGTLSDRMRGGSTRGRVYAKTGTTSVASALSGFVDNRYAFSVLQNGYPLPYWWARVAQDRFATILAAS
jgi:D-alanyl-D-alanine carboxypeptidase/D-alanyl-D-alanine-endopeptidase (penicillin-binding protein 4)